VAASARALKAVAIHLAALGDPEPIWRDWLEDASRRFRVDVTALDEELPNWRQLLERFAEERAPVYFRRDAEVSGAIRRLEAAGTRIGVFTDAPAELARVALSHLGALNRVEALESGIGAEVRVVRRLGDGATVVRTRDELLRLT
jgi:phosphoglycolate phosphatase-like HAD superfamily hydrolase